MNSSTVLESIVGMLHFKVFSTPSITLTPLRNFTLREGQILPVTQMVGHSMFYYFRGSIEKYKT
jgi:hypothetical protein